jgi:hypothetical protein
MRKTKRNLLQQCILIYNFFNLSVADSIAKGKVSFPNIRKINTFEGTLADVESNREYLVSVRNRLRERLEPTE